MHSGVDSFFNQIGCYVYFRGKGGGYIKMGIPFQDNLQTSAVLHKFTIQPPGS